MCLTADELAKQGDFERQYRLGQLAAVKAVERAVCGCAYGATSWATRAEADRITAALALGPGVSLLEIGAGSGWPALHMAALTGCDLYLSDLPPDALQIAVERAATDGIAGACSAVAANAAQLPFRSAGFDAINHSDVLCCLVQKREVLAECRRVIRPAGRMAFSVIYIAPGLSPEDHAEAIETAPPFAGTDTSYPDLVAETGWTIRQRDDLTAQFMADCRNMLTARRARRTELEPLSGAEDFDASQSRMKRRIAVLERGDMRRELFVVEPAN